MFRICFFVDVEDVTLVPFFGLARKRCLYSNEYFGICVWPRGCLWQVWTSNTGIDYQADRS